MRGNPWAILVVVSLGFFMTLLDLTIVNIAIPNMIAKLHASLDDVLWVLNAYALVLAVLVITAGRLGDLIGTRTMFVAGIALFTAASAACGFAPGSGWLIAFRSVQGLGAAMLMPQTLAIVTMTFPPERRGAAFGIWGAVAGLALQAGDRGGVDDDAALAVAVGGLGPGHGGGRDAHQVEGTDQVDADDPPVAGQVVRGAVAADRPRGPADARAADRGAQRGARGGRGVHRRLDRGLIGHVGAREQAVDLAGHPLAVLLVQVGDEHHGARRGEHPRGRLAQPARAPGHDRRRTVQVHARSILGWPGDDPRSPPVRSAPRCGAPP